MHPFITSRRPLCNNDPKITLSNSTLSTLSEESSDVSTTQISSDRSQTPMTILEECHPAEHQYRTPIIKEPCSKQVSKIASKLRNLRRLIKRSKICDEEVGEKETSHVSGKLDEPNQYHMKVFTGDKMAHSYWRVPEGMIVSSEDKGADLKMSATTISAVVENFATINDPTVNEKKVDIPPERPGKLLVVQNEDEKKALIRDHARQEEVFWSRFKGGGHKLEKVVEIVSPSFQRDTRILVEHLKEVAEYMSEFSRHGEGMSELVNLMDTLPGSWAN